MSSSTELVRIKSRLTTVFKECIESVKPGPLVKETLRVNVDRLVCRGKEFPLNKNVTLVGFGKAALEMAGEAENVLGHHVVKGILSIPKGTRGGHILPQKYQVFEGAENNLPDEEALNAAKQIYTLAQGLSYPDLLLVLISGGGSALLPLPRTTVTLGEKLQLIRRLIGKGVDIKELNCVRKGLSRIKGGGLAIAAYPATVLSLLLSDVIGDPLESIASGPTAPPSPSCLEPIRVLAKYGLLHDTPQGVIGALSKRSPTSMDFFQNVSNYIIGNNSLALHRGREWFIKEGIPCALVSNSITGFTHDIARHYSNLTSNLYSIMTKSISESEGFKRLMGLRESLCTQPENLINLSKTAYGANQLVVLFGGEPTVKVQGGGVGGRSQELALRFSMEIDGLDKDLTAVLLCGGTDGIDGPTDAAGGFGYKGLLGEAQSAGLDLSSYLMRNDSYTFLSLFSNGENMLKIGPTGTNVMDIHLLYLSRHKS